MFAVLAVLVAVVAWAIQSLGDGIEDPFAWVFAILALIAAELAVRIYPRYPWRS
jgi:hypothetical protein